MKIKGNWETREVTVDGVRLDPSPSQAVWNHSPDGFSYGYNGSGPAKLALALLLYAGVDKDLAVAKHQALKEEFVAKLPQSDFETELEISRDDAWWILSKPLAFH